MKITAKTTKQELKNILGANVKAVKEQDKDLFDRIAYADKVSKTDDSKVTRKDLVDLVKEVMKVLGDKIVEPALAQEKPAEETPVEQPKAENSVKKLSKGKKQKESVPEEVGESEQTAEETQETPADVKTEEKVDTKKSAKKSLGKKEQPKKDGDTDSSKKTVQTKAFVLADVFPDTFELDGNKFEIARDIANIGQLHDALNKDEALVFAMYWTKRHIKQFGYGVNALKAPKEFPMDLDIATCIYVSDDSVVAYAVSSYTEVCYMYLPDDIEESDGIRYANGVEYQIYRMF